MLLSRRLLLATALTCTVGISGFAAISIHLFSAQQQYAELFDRDVTCALSAERAAAHLKVEVQEWKDVIIRGFEAGAREKYYSQMEAEHHIVNTAIDQVRDRLEQDDDLPGLMALITAFRQSHISMVEGYRRAVDEFDRILTTGTHADALVAADRLVRGIDREPTAQLEALATRLVDRANRRATMMNATTRDRMIVTVACGCVVFSGVLLITVLASRRIIARLNGITMAFRKLVASPTDEAKPMDPGPADEIGELARNFNEYVRLQADRSRGERMSLQIARRVTGRTGHAFFDALACEVSRLLDIDQVHVVEFVPGAEAIRTMAAATPAGLQPRSERPLDGTPCAAVRRSGVATRCLAGACDQYPGIRALAGMDAQACVVVPLPASSGPPVGAISAYYRDAQTNVDLAEYVLGVFASRAGAEIERSRLEAEAGQAQQLIERSTNEIYVIDVATHQFINVNASARSNLGYSMEELRRMSPLDLRATDDRPGLKDVFGPLFTGEKSVVELSSVHRRKDGSTYPVELVLQRLTIGGQGLVSAVGQDVTVRRQLEAQLLHSHKLEAIGRLAGGVAHDFNNLLTAIIGHVDLTLPLVEPGEPVTTALEDIRNSAATATDLTGQLLSFARRQVVHPVVIDTAERLQGLVRMLTPTLGETIRIDLDCRASSHVRIDPGAFEQLVLNLAVNARDAMPEGGSLLIETRDTVLDEDYARLHPDVTPGPYVQLTVTDTGAGMDASTRERAFEPFFTTRGSGGTGLGLATCHGIVRQSGGHIWIYSEPGSGTSIKVYFPMISAPADPVVPQPAVEPVQGDGETILVVEDDAHVRAVCVRTLVRRGYVVLQAGSVAEALELAASRESLDALVTDVVLPDGRGHDMADKVLERFPGLPVLFVSGYTENTVIRNGEVVAGVNFLQKPYTPATLTAALQAVLRGRA
ncbi:MAG: ATP-binding protein [Planctomycetota bacterium]